MIADSVSLVGTDFFAVDLGVTGFGPEVLFWGGVAADLQANEMVEFVIGKIGVSVVGVPAADFFLLQRVRIGDRRADTLS